MRPRRGRGEAQIPLLSVGIPVYNGERYLDNALDCVRRQTLRDIEIIVSDNASTDATPEICHRHATEDDRIRYVRNPDNLGAAENFNAVFRLSRGRFFKWTSHDDEVAPQFLERCVDVLSKRAGVVLCFSKTKVIDEEGRAAPGLEYDLDWDAPAPSRRFGEIVLQQHGCESVFGVIRSSTLRKTPLIGNYIASDRVLLSELALYGQFYELPEPLFYHRQHAARAVRSNTSKDKMTEWFDPGRKGTIVIPHVRVLMEHNRSVSRAAPPIGERMRCLAHLARWAWRNRLRIKWDLGNAVRERIRRARSRSNGSEPQVTP